MYAIIEDSGTQIKVAQGDIIKIDCREFSGTTISFDKVLFIGGGESSAKIGLPLVAGAKVTAEVLGEERGEKIAVVKFRRRKNYKRMRGHRQDYIKVKITSIQG